MDYQELARQFIQNSYRTRRTNHPQNKIDETMRGEVFVLTYVSRKAGGVLPSEISSEMQISTARIAAALNGLENKGLITRRIDTKDRRKILVELTDAGKVQVEKNTEKLINRTTKMLTLLGEEDAREYVRIMGRLADLASQITDTDE